MKIYDFSETLTRDIQITQTKAFIFKARQMIAKHAGHPTTYETTGDEDHRIICHGVCLQLPLDCRSSKHVFELWKVEYDQRS
ncbi:hypothetical protein [Ruegeria atlantica]|uniref:Uncharacterized protein n=1 Tax=Ruegeria atlantica TaxID=81569 RepID=A0A0P1EZP9_9RHOB|nr:hypothetical protein [Ruegeria atlantica]CUH48953.1 hypothetical protein RUA4292_03144 [Ruegeria atlantica]